MTLLDACAACTQHGCRDGLYCRHVCTTASHTAAATMVSRQCFSSVAQQTNGVMMIQLSCCAIKGLNWPTQRGPLLVAFDSVQKRQQQHHHTHHHHCHHQCYPVPTPAPPSLNQSSELLPSCTPCQHHLMALPTLFVPDSLPSCHTAAEPPRNCPARAGVATSDQRVAVPHTP